MAPQTSTVATEIEAIAQLLAEASVGGVVTYDQIEAVTGRKIKECRFSLMKARDQVEKSLGALFDTIQRVGVKRLNATEAAGVGALTRRRIGKSARRTYGRLSGFAANDVDARTRARIDAERSIMGAVSSLVAADMVAKVEKTSPTAPLPPAKVAKLLMQSGGAGQERDS